MASGKRNERRPGDGGTPPPDAPAVAAAPAEAAPGDAVVAPPPAVPPRPRPGSRRLYAGDVVGGLAGLAVALPQAMGLGIALFAAMGLDAPGGALAGLIGAAAISLASGLGGNTLGMISAPNGPVVIFLIGALASVAGDGVAAADLPTALAVLVVLAGAFQVLLGLTGGGQLIKYIPYPVVSGLVTAIGALMIGSQLPSLLGGPAGVARMTAFASGLLVEALGLDAPERPIALGEAIWLLMPAATTVVTLLGIYLVPLRWPRIPGIVGGFVLGLAFFHAIAAVAPGPVPAAWVVGAIPGPESLAHGMTSAGLAALPWSLLVVSGMALAVVASIDCMVTAVVADAATGSRHDSRGELVAQGIGQAVAGLLGGCGGGGTKGSTLTAIHAGGRRWSAVVAAIGVIALVLLLRPVGNALPISVLAGAVIHVGFHMLDWRIVAWLRTRKARVDGVLALAVVAAAMAFDVTAGVGVGAVGSALLFIRGQSGATAVHERATGRERRSLRHRGQAEKALLDAHGERILYIELRGHLFFGTVDRLFTELYDDLRRPVWIVINMRRVQSLDMSGLNLLRQMTALITANGGQLLFANIYPDIAPDRKMGKLLRLLGPGEKGFKARTFKSSDKALQYAEDGLLAELTGQHPNGSSKRVEVDANELCRDMRPKTRAALRKVLRPVTMRPKARFYGVGETDAVLFLVVKGEVDIRLPTDKYHYKRLKRVGPGGFFGEMSFLNPAPRVTTAVAVTEVEALALDPAAIARNSDAATTEAIQALCLQLGTELAAQMRWASAEICRLERW